MPREYPDTDQVEFTGRVARPDYEEFIGRFPMYGATTWFIRTALSRFLAECQANPSLDDIIIEAIRNMTSDPFSIKVD